MILSLTVLLKVTEKNFLFSVSSSNSKLELTRFGYDFSSRAKETELQIEKELRCSGASKTQDTKDEADDKKILMNLYKGIKSGDSRIKIVIIKVFFGLEGS